jgi:hypothetical protein
MNASIGDSRGLPGNDVASVERMGWKGIGNGRLLSLAAEHFDIFITGDRNLSFQQNIPDLRIAVVVLAAPSTRLKDTLPLMPKVLALLPQLKPGTVTKV